MAERPKKIPNLKAVIRTALSIGNYRFKAHCLIRMQERDLLHEEVLYVLQEGRHEPANDEFKPEHQTWNYSIRGKTLDAVRELRVGVSFDEESRMIIVTAIDLGQKD